jgi:flagellar biosynthesis protein FlhF
LKIKRFFAKDMRQALFQVKEELGADAVIMSNKKVAGGVEIVAAVDGESAAVTPRQMEPSSFNPPPALQNKDFGRERDLQDDKVSINRGAVDHKNGTMTDRFANMLKHYRGGTQDAEPKRNSDSLSALLDRQAEQNNSTASAFQSADKYQYSQQARLGRRDSQSQRSMGHAVSESQTPKYNTSSRSRSDQQIDQELESMKEDMSSIRRLLEHQVSGLMWQEVERREPLRAMLIKRLERMGIASELADQLACYIPEDTPPRKAWNALLSLVSDQVVVSKQDILRQGGIVALLGPTGVGKTTTVAKLAARAAMEYGADNVALVTTDTYRIGAHEQLSIYGRIMGCPVRVAKDSEQLADVLYQLRNRRLVLIDTAGMGQRDVRLSEQLDTLMQESGEVINSYLVLPATAQRQVLQETLEHFRRIPLSGCIMTKLDESLSLGEFISVVIQNALPVTYIANGQRVPEDIVIAQPRYMVAKANELLEKSTENEPHFWNSDVEGV